jgi:hypothetical protein
MSNYPEHDKLKALEGKNQKMGYILDRGLKYYSKAKLASLFQIVSCMVEGNGPTPIELCKFINWFSENKKEHTHSSIQRILSAYYGIDEQKLDAEKREMLDLLREAGV